MMALAALTAFAGFAALCLAMPRHHRQVLQTAPGRGRQILLRLGGSLAIVLSFLCSGLAWGWKIGPVAWLGLLTLAGLGLVFLLPGLARAEIYFARFRKNDRPHSS